MPNWTFRTAAMMALSACLVLAQAPAARVVGTVATVSGSNLTLKTDSGETVSVETTPEVKVQKVAPGERDLSKAQTIAIADIAAGDRVLLRGAKASAGFRAESIIVMTAREIAQRDESTRKLWQERGVFGVVEEVNPATGEVRIASRGSGAAGGAPVVVVISDKTNVRRYAPDSIRFADAQPAKTADIRKGDQLRAMGEKSADGARIAGEQVVFGTFKTLAGTVTNVQADQNQVALKDIQTGKTVRVNVKPDSQLKKFSLPGGGPGAGMGMRPGGPPAAGGAGGEDGRTRMGGRAGGRAPDVAGMFERMPATTLGEIKTGDTLIVSSTVGAKPDEITAIAVLAGAEPVIDMLRARGGSQGGPDPLAGGGSSLDRGLEGMLGMPTQ